MLRDLRYQLASAVLENFSLEKDDVQRKAVCKIKGRGLARYRGNGEFIIDVPKEMKLVTGANTEWIFNTTTIANGGILSQTLHSKLPAKAKNVHLSPGGDFDNLIYTVDSPASRPKGFLVAGLLLMLTGVSSGVASTFMRKRSSTIYVPAPRHDDKPPTLLPPS